MSNVFKVTQVDGFDKELLLVGEGYMARPVTLNKATVSGLVADDKGHYIIPQGIYLTGAAGSLLLNPQQNAVAVVPTVAKASATVGTALVVTAKADGGVAYSVELTKGTSKYIKVTADATKATVALAVDSKGGDIISTNADVVKAINSDTTANTYVSAALATGANGDDLAVVTAAVATSNGAADAVASDIDGILYHSVDVTDGEATGAMIYKGVINIDNMPEIPGAAVKAKLPNIVFARRD